MLSQSPQAEMKWLFCSKPSLQLYFHYCWTFLVSMISRFLCVVLLVLRAFLLLGEEASCSALACRHVCRSMNETVKPLIPQQDSVDNYIAVMNGIYRQTKCYIFRVFASLLQSNPSIGSVNPPVICSPMRGNTERRKSASYS